MCLGVPGRVIDIRIERGTRVGTVEFDGVTTTVCLAYTPEIEVGDHAIVHAGFALQRLDEASARETLRVLSEIGATGPDDASDEGDGEP